MDPQIRSYLQEKEIEVYIFGADQLAREMGSVQSVNIAMIGFASAHPRFPFSHEKLRGAMERVTPSRFKDLSLKIFEKAFVEGSKVTKR